MEECISRLRRSDDPVFETNYRHCITCDTFFNNLRYGSSLKESCPRNPEHARVCKITCSPEDRAELLSSLLSEKDIWLSSAISNATPRDIVDAFSVDSLRLAHDCHGRLGCPLLAAGRDLHRRLRNRLDLVEGISLAEFQAERLSYRW